MSIEFILSDLEIEFYATLPDIRLNKNEQILNINAWTPNKLFKYSIHPRMCVRIIMIKNEQRNHEFK